jgi:ribokinase
VGAGDAFNGGLAAALSNGASTADALRWASITAAISTTAIGAVTGLPDAGQVEAAMSAWDSGLEPFER